VTLPSGATLKVAAGGEVKSLADCLWSVEPDKWLTMELAEVTMEAEAMRETLSR
jgi:hypothetical protein